MNHFTPSAPFPIPLSSPSDPPQPYQSIRFYKGTSESVSACTNKHTCLISLLTEEVFSPPPPACVWSALDWLLVTQLSPSAFEWSGIVSLTRILLPHTTKERPSFHPYTHTFTHAYIEEQTVESSLRAAVTFFPSV